MAVAAEKRSFADFNGGIEPENFIFEDDQCVVLHETTNKQSPIHFIVVPKRAVLRLSEASKDDEKLLGHMLLIVKQVALEMGLSTGYHVMVDENHRTHKLTSLHVFGRALHHMLWPVGPGNRL